MYAQDVLQNIRYITTPTQYQAAISIEFLNVYTIFVAINVYLRVQFTAKLTGNIVSGMPNIANFILCPRVVYSKLYCLRFKTILSKNMILDTRIG